MGLMGEFVLAYTKNFSDKKPWEMRADDRGEVLKFINDFARMDVERDFREKEYLKSEQSLNPRIEERLEYYHDLIGFDDKDYQKVLAGRIEYFVGIFMTASKGKDEMISLSIEEDGYCRACAIGSHCKRTNLQKVLKTDKDYEYLHYLSGFSKNGLTKVGDGLYITAELLFDSSFHSFLRGERIRVIAQAYEVC